MVNHVVSTLAGIISILMMVYVGLWSLLQTFNANPLQHFLRVWAQLFLYYAGFTMPWWALLAIAAGLIGKLPLEVGLLLAAAAGIYGYLSVLLPSQLRTQRHQIDLGLETPWRVAVLGNLKVGLFSGKSRHVQQWVQTLNTLEVDAIIVTGDWLYHPGADLVGQLMLLKALNKPVYTVMSRTDLIYQSHSLSAQGQPLLEDTLTTAFAALDIIDISQQALHLVKPKALLCGWQDDQAIALIKQRQQQSTASVCQVTKSVRPQPQNKQYDPSNFVQSHIIAEVNNDASLRQELLAAEQPVIVLAAHYDRVYELPKLSQRPLVIAGDGRSGRYANGSLPYKLQPEVAAIKSRHPFLARHDGLHQHELAQVFVAHGVGMSRWPFRISPPTIDILDIR